MATIDREITELLHRLPEAQQQRVLEFARGLAEVRAQGIPGENIYLETEVMPDAAIGRKGGAVSRAEFYHAPRARTPQAGSRRGSTRRGDQICSYVVVAVGDTVVVTHKSVSGPISS